MNWYCEARAKLPVRSSCPPPAPSSESRNAFAPAAPLEAALRIRGEVGFFLAQRAVLIKSRTERPSGMEDELDATIRQIVSGAVASDQVAESPATVGLKRLSVSILSDEFVAEARQLPPRASGDR